MKIKLLIIAFLLFSLSLFSQKKGLNCLAFSKGVFRSSTGSSDVVSTIVRKGEKQMEITDGVKSYKKIQWLNDCDYILTFPKKEAKNDKFKKFINENGGISVNPEKIDGKTLYYKTSYFDGKKEIVTEGKLIKVSNNGKFK